jgi:hypothetical protein
MAYTIEQAIDDALVWTKRLTVTNTLGRPEMRLLLREAFQRQYDLAVIGDAEFFIKTAAYGSSAAWAFPLNYRQTVLVEVPAAPRAGAARRVDAAEWYRMVQNTRIGPTANDPIYRETSTGLILSPAVAGTWYYIRTYGDTLLDVEATDLETTIPRPFHQGIVFEMVSLARKRHFKDAQIRPEAEKMLSRARDSHRLTMKSLYPLIQSQLEQPAPGTVAAGQR